MATLSTVYGVAPAFIINPPTMIATNPSPSPTITNSRPRSTPRRPISFSPSSTTKGAASKKVVQAAAAATNAANGSVDAAAVAAGKRRKRGRASELTRKYRPVSDFDESILIGDNDNSSGTNSFFSSIKDNLSTTKTKKNISQDGLINNITNIKKRQIQQQQQQQQQQQKQQEQQERQQQRKVQDKRKNIIPCYSRFPSKWDDALSQMCGSTALALARGFDRLKINVENVYPYLYQQQHQLQAQNNNEQIDEITLLTHAACILLRHVIGKDAKHPTIKEVGSFYCTQNQSLQQYSNTNNMEFQSKMDQNSFTPRGAVLLFNSQQDLNNSQNIIKNYLPKNVKVGVLGEVNPTEFIGNIIIVVKPSNRNNNPINIEYVEHVHYSNFHIKNWVIFLNPNLISLSNFQTVHRESKLPLFMGDYLSTFYVEPITFPNYVGNGGSNAGVLRCYPRKWELYMSKNNITSNKFNDINNCGLRLVSEQKIQPSREKIQCEFSWRIQREIEQGPEEQIRVG